MPHVELVQDGILVLAEQFFQFKFSGGFLFQNSFLGNVCRIGAFHGDARLEATHDFTIPIITRGDTGVGNNRINRLLGSTGNPYLPVTSQAQVFNHRLQVK